jgi:tetratricopeptide (TPR) repeat protein
MAVQVCLLAIPASSQVPPPEDQQTFLRILPLFERGEYGQAEQQLKAALEQYPDSAVLENALGVLYRKTNRTTEAAAAFEKALRSLPTFTAAQLQLAAIYEEQGRTNDAADLFVRAGEGATDANAIAAAAIGAAECGASQRAIALFEKARAAGADSPALRYNLALAEYNAGENRAALETLRGVATDGPEVLYLRGRIREALQDPGAADDFTKACKNDAAVAEHCVAAAAELARQEHFATALEAAETGLTKTPDSGALLTLRGMSLFRLGRYGEARTVYGRVLEHDPRLYAAREGLAFLLYTTGDLEEARRTAEAALSDANADFYLFHLHSMILARMSPELRGQAMRSVEEAIRRNPSFAPAFFLRGKLRLKSNDDQDAEADFLTAAKLDPKFPLPHYQLARLYFREGKIVQAEAEEKQLSVLGNMREEEALARQTQDVVLSAAR